MLRQVSLKIIQSQKCESIEKGSLMIKLFDQSLEALLYLGYRNSRQLPTVKEGRIFGIC